MCFLSCQGYLEFLQTADVPSFLAQPEIEHIKSTVQVPSHSSSIPDLTYHDRGLEDEGSSDTYWPMQSDLAAPGLDLGWPLPQHCFIGPTEVTTLVNPSDPDMPSIKEQARRLIKNAHQVREEQKQQHFNKSHKKKKKKNKITGHVINVIFNIVDSILLLRLD